MIKVLLTNGCSHTAGNEHADHSFKELAKTAWPGVLGECLGLETINIGKGGSSNQRIMRTTIQEITKLTNRGYKIHEILVGIMWSYTARQEFNLGFQFNKNDWLQLDPGQVTGLWTIRNKKDQEMCELARIWFEQFQTNEHDSLLFFNNFLVLQTFLKKYDVPYFFQFVGSSQPRELRLNPLMYNLVDETKLFFHKNKQKCFREWAESNNYKRGPKGHFLEQAHYDFVYEHLGPLIKKSFYSKP